MTVSTTIRAKFRATGAFDPDEFTAAVGLAPTLSARRGEPLSPRRPTRARRFANDLWEFAREEIAATEIGLEVASLLAALEPARSALLTFKTDHALEFEMRVVMRVIDRDLPYVGLEAEQIQQLASFQLSLDCDVYFVDGRASSTSPLAG